MAPAKDRPFLGSGCWYAAGGAVKRRVEPKALASMQERVRQISRRAGGGGLVQVCRVNCGAIWWGGRRISDSPTRTAWPVLRVPRSAAAGTLVNFNSPNRGCGPECPVVWEGSRRESLSYFPIPI